MLNFLRNLNSKFKHNSSSGFASIDAIRGRLESMDYECASDLEKLCRAQRTAIISNAIENSLRTDEEVDFDKLMIELRIPAGPVRRQATDWLISFMLSKA